MSNSVNTSQSRSQGSALTQPIPIEGKRTDVSSYVPWVPQPSLKILLKASGDDAVLFMGSYSQDTGSIQFQLNQVDRHDHSSDFSGQRIAYSETRQWTYLLGHKFPPSVWKKIRRHLNRSDLDKVQQLGSFPRLVVRILTEVYAFFMSVQGSNVPLATETRQELRSLYHHYLKIAFDEEQEHDMDISL